VADEVFLEDRDIALRGLEVEVAEQLGTDVDGQAAVDQVGSEQAPEVMRREAVPREPVTGLGQLVAEPLQHVPDRARADDARAANLTLEQERHRR
jgi:hypothetical protein